MVVFYEGVNKKLRDLILKATLFCVEADSLFMKCKLEGNFLFCFLS